MIQRVAVIGAGTIGVGIAQCLAQAKYDVTLIDVSADILEEARRRIKRGIRLYKLIAGNARSASTREILSRIQGETALASCKDVDFVIENVTEDWSVKRGIYVELDRIAPPACIFAVNTSAIPISRFAEITQRPEKVLGIHFMNPVPLKNTVEMIRTKITSRESLDIASQLLESMGKSHVLVNDSPGFVSNRVLMLTINEAIQVVHEGVAPAKDVDRIFTGAFGHAMGPLETADLIGLDTILLTLNVLLEELGDSRFEPSPLLREKVAAGELGDKTGQGFFKTGMAGVKQAPEES